jgi:inosine/xanthosine triphosphate pyrophosphatase family protein
MLDGFDDRSATATTSYCYYDGKEMSFFEGMVHGRVADHPEGEGGHGWDSLFIADGQSKTRGSMDDAEYASTPNPRGLAVEKLKKFLEEAE